MPGLRALAGIALLMLIAAAMPVHPTFARDRSADPSLTSHQAERWTRFGGIFGDPSVRAFAVDSQGRLYVGGEFDWIGDPQTGIPANNIARWDGQKWETFGEGVSGPIDAMEFAGDDLYIGGSFSVADGVFSPGIVRLHTSPSSGKQAGFFSVLSGTNGRVTAMHLLAGWLYVFGEFTAFNGSPASRAFLLSTADPSNYTVRLLNATLTGAIFFTLAALTGTVDVIMALGFFEALNNGKQGDPIENVAYLDPTTLEFSPIGGGTNARATAATAYGGGYVIGGYFSASADGATPLRGVAFAQDLDGPVTEFGGGVSGFVTSMIQFENTLMMAGDISDAGNGKVAANNVVGWTTNQEWIPMGALHGPLSLEVQLFNYDNKAIAGGNFHSSDAGTASGYAEWSSGSTDWAGLPFGFKGGNVKVTGVATTSEYLYVVGRFQTAADQVASNVARQNLTSGAWEPVWDGFNFEATSIYATDEDHVFVGGTFNRSGGRPVNRIAWSNHTEQRWDQVGVGLSNTVRAIAGLSPYVVVAGGFSQGFDTSIELEGVAFFDEDTHTLQPMGGGLSGNAESLHIDEQVPGKGQVPEMAGAYVGGVFDSTADATVQLNQVGYWDMQSDTWSPLGPGLGTSSSDRVLSLQLTADHLYAGGQFSTTGDGVVDLKSIARWDFLAQEWQPLANGGLNRPVITFYLDETELYMGGEFTFTADFGVSYPRIVRWDLNDEDWVAVGAGLNGIVRDLHAFEDDLWIAGDFTTAGGQPSYWLTTWSLASGVSVPLSGMNWWLDDDGLWFEWSLAPSFSSDELLLQIASEDHFQTMARVEAAGQRRQRHRIATPPTGSYRFRIAWAAENGELEKSPELNFVVGAPSRLVLYAPVPNPFNPATQLSFELPASARANMAVYDLRGRHIKTLLDETRDAGVHSVIWDGTDTAGRRVASGAYIVRLKAGPKLVHQKLILAK